MDKVAFRVELEGMEKLHQLKREADALDGKKLQLNIDKSKINAQISDIRKEIQAIQGQKATISIQTREANAQIKELKQNLKELEKERDKKIRLVLDSQIDQQIIHLSKELNALEKERERRIRMSIDTQQIDIEIAKINAKINSLENKNSRLMLDASQANEEIRKIEKEIKSLENAKAKLDIDSQAADEKIKSLRNDIKALESNKTRLNIETTTANQSLRETKAQIKQISDELSLAQQNAVSFTDVLSGIGNFLENAGGMLSELHSMFGGTFTSALMRRLTRSFARGVFDSFGDAVSRYDTFKTFPSVMGVLGFGEQADKIVSELNDSVQGLPTSLNEIVESAQEFIMLTNNADKGKNLAISVNNALLASGRDYAKQLNAREQIINILTGGDLTKDQWTSLFNGLGISMQFIAEAFGYSRDEVAKFEGALIDGTHSADEFVEVLAKAGQEGGIADLTSITTDQLSSSITNLKTAVVNAEASLLQEVDKVLLDTTGKTLVGHVISVSDGIKQKLIPAMREWIQEHPDAITNFLDKLQNYDWIGLIGKIGKGAVDYFQFMTKFFSSIPTGFISFMATKGGLVGKGLTLIGKGLKVFAGGFGFFAGMKGIGNVKNIFSKDKGIGGIFSEGLTLKGIGLKTLNTTVLIGEIALVGLVIKEYAKIAEDIGSMDFGKFDQNIKPLSKFIGAVSGITAGITALMTGIGMTGIGGLGVLIGEGLTAGFIAIIALVGRVIKQYANLAQQIGDYNMPSNMGAKVRALGDFVSSLGYIDFKPIGLINVSVQKSVSKNMAKVVDNIVAMAESIKQINDLHISNSTIKRTGEKISNLVDVMGNTFNGIKEAFDSKTWIGLKFDKSSTGSIGSIVDGMNSVIKDLGKTAEELIDMDEPLKQLFPSRGTRSAHRWNKLKGNIDNLIEELGSVFNGLKETFDSTTWVGLKFDKSSSDSINYVLNNMNEAIGLIGDTAQGILDLREGFSKIYKEFETKDVRGKTHIQNLESVFFGEDGQIGRLIKEIGGVFSSLEENLNLDEYGEIMSSDQSSIYVNDILTNLKSSIGTIGDITGSFLGLYDDLAKIFATDKEYKNIDGSKKLSKLDTIIERFNGIIGNKKDKTGLAGIFENLVENLNTEKEWFGKRKLKGESKNSYFMTDILDNIKISIGQIGDVVTSLDGMSDDIYRLVNAKGSKNIENITDNINKIIGDGTSGLGGVFNAIANAFAVNNSDYSQLLDRISTSEAIAPMMENLSTAMKSFGDIVGALQDIHNEYTNFLGAGTQISDTNNQPAHANNVLGKLNNLMGSASDGTGLMGMFTGLNELGSQDIFIDDSVTSVVDNIKKGLAKFAGKDGILAKLSSMKDEITSMSGMDDGEVTFEIGDRLNAIVDSISEAFSTINSTDIGEDISGKIEEISGAVDQLKILFDKLRQIESVMGGLVESGELGTTSPLGEGISKVLTGLTTALNGISLSGGENLSGALETVNGLIDDFTSKLGEASSAMDKLKSSSDNAKSSIDNLKASIENLKSALENAMGSIHGTAGALRNLASSGYGASSAMYAAEGAARALAAAISRIPPYKKVVVDVQQKGSVNTRGLPPATGGLIDAGKVIYRALGGSVFRKKGTDTVPAMLTPGEYVVRRPAVKAIGADVLQRINNLDIDGAFKTLMIRAGQGIVPRNINNVTNNYRDNHATVTINNRNGSSGYGLRRIGRWVQAL